MVARVQCIAQASRQYARCAVRACTTRVPARAPPPRRRAARRVAQGSARRRARRERRRADWRGARRTRARAAVPRAPRPPSWRHRSTGPTRASPVGCSPSCLCRCMWHVHAHVHVRAHVRAHVHVHAHVHASVRGLAAAASGAQGCRQGCSPSHADLNCRVAGLHGCRVAGLQPVARRAHLQSPQCLLEQVELAALAPWRVQRLRLG